MLNHNHFNKFVLMHAGYLFVSDALSTPAITEPPSVARVPGSFHSSQICVRHGKNRFIVSSEGLGLHKILE